MKVSDDVKVTQPADVNNISYYLIGLLIMIINCAWHKIFGYKTPRTFSAKDVSRSVDYDFDVVKNWNKYLVDYSKQTDFLRDKVVLEIGPGPDLGIGLILLAMGAKKYIAFDTNKLIVEISSGLYDELFARLNSAYPNYDMDHMKKELSKCYKEEDGMLNYIVDNNFTVSKVTDKIDIIFSQAAFEHIIDIEETFRELTSIAKKGSILIAEIDLKTHTRWIRDKDPLNIYRYGDFLWNLFKFKGAPNRIRVFEYKKILEKNGWIDVQIFPLNMLENIYFEKVKYTLHKKFRKIDPSDMKILSFMVMAKKG